MDENVMRVLQMLEDGKISTQEAETLIAALRGESSRSEAKTSAPGEEKQDRPFMGGFEFGTNFKRAKIDLDDLGERISKAVSKVQPDKIVRRVQAQLRTAARAGSTWSATVSTRVQNWTNGTDTRPENPGLPEQTETHEQNFHLESGANIMIDNPYGNVHVTSITEGPAVVVATKTVWQARSEDLKTAWEELALTVHGTDTKLDVNVSATDNFHAGTLDLELRVPESAVLRVVTHFGEVHVSGLQGRVEAVTTAGALQLDTLGGDVRGETASGDIDLSEIQGAVAVATQSGDIRARKINRGLAANAASGDVSASDIEGGRVECKSVSGDVIVERVGIIAPLDITVESVSGDARLIGASGNIAVKAVSGDLTADDLSAARLQAQTISGEIKLRLREPFSGMMQVNTVSGDVRLALMEGSNARLSMSTTSGDLRCELDAQNVVATETLWTGQIGTGAGTINVQTIAGDTRLERAS